MTLRILGCSIQPPRPMADGDRVQVILECTEEPGTSRYHTTKNRKNDSDRIEVMKYNPVLQKHTLHRETK